MYGHKEASLLNIEFKQYVNTFNSAELQCVGVVLECHNSLVSLLGYLQLAYIPAT